MKLLFLFFVLVQSVPFQDVPLWLCGLWRVRHLKVVVVSVDHSVLLVMLLLGVPHVASLLLMSSSPFQGLLFLFCDWLTLADSVEESVWFWCSSFNLALLLVTYLL
jgi:hypothetical protein